MRPRTYKTIGFIIKRINFSEADKILTIYSWHYGKICGIAKGVRKMTSRKAGSLELFNLTAIYLARGKNLDIICETQLINSFPAFRKNLTKVSLAYQFCELVDRLAPEHQANQQLYNLLKDSLEKLSSKEVKLSDLAIAFKRDLLNCSGFGCPSSQEESDLDRFLEEIMERKINSKQLLKRIS